MPHAFGSPRRPLHEKQLTFLRNCCIGNISKCNVNAEAVICSDVPVLRPAEEHQPHELDEQAQLYDCQASNPRLI